MRWRTAVDVLGTVCASGIAVDLGSTIFGIEQWVPTWAAAPAIFFLAVFHHHR